MRTTPRNKQNARRNARRLFATVSGLILCACPAASAQWGYGGFGYGFNYQPPEIGFINQKSLLNASRATMGPVQNNVYANNPNAYINKLHDPGYLDKWDVNTRRSIESSIGRFSDGPAPRSSSSRTRTTTTSAPAPTQTAQAGPPPAPDIPLSSFFDRYQKLVWPDQAPVFGEFQGLKSTSDLSSLAVYNEYNLRGLAQLSTVTDARSKLLAYGQPALKYVRENSTPRVADSFHLFLLSLYESLAQAATVPKQAAPAAAPTPAPAANPGQ